VTSASIIAPDGIRRPAVATDRFTQLALALTHPTLVLYLRGERVQFVFGKDSGLDWVIEAAGAIDVGTELGVVDNAPLTAESVLRAAPDVFLVSTTGLESVGGLDGLLAIPGIAQTPAGEASRVIAHPDQYLFGTGSDPRSRTQPTTTSGE
jgi:iron complex transport system substrate-binding protein